MNLLTLTKQNFNRINSLLFKIQSMPIKFNELTWPLSNVNSYTPNAGNKKYSQH